ncbi:MAG: hypothetical protein GX421_00215, partial [Caldisericales bacterium]|nr:hypothetical protein [Caldisericales bacterium]
MILVFGQGVSAITGNQDSCEKTTNNLSTNSQDQGVAFPLLPYSGDNQTLYNTINDEGLYPPVRGNYYIKYSGFGFSCIDKRSGYEVPTHLLSEKIINAGWKNLKFFRNSFMISDLSEIIQIDETRFCATRQENHTEHLIMFDQNGIKWNVRLNSAISWHLSLLGSKNIFYGTNIIDIETGKVLLELDKKYDLSHFATQDKFALIDDSLMIDINEPAILWTIPEEKYSTAKGFYGDILITINRKTSLVRYYDAASGKVLRSFKFKPLVKPWEYAGEPGLIVGKSVCCRSGYVVDIESGTILTRKKCNIARGMFTGWQYFLWGDKEYLFWEDIAGTECIDTKTGKTLWIKEDSYNVSYQKFDDKIYKNTFHFENEKDGEKTYTESLSILENGSWRELARVPFWDAWRTLIPTDGLSLRPTRYGILWLPYYKKESAGPSIIAPGTSKILKTYQIECWSEQNIPSYALVGDTVIVNHDGLGINLVDLESGKIEYIEIPGATSSGSSSFESVPLFASNQYVVTQDAKRNIVCFDIVKKVFLRKFEPSSTSGFYLRYWTNHLFVGEWFSLDWYIINLETGELVKIRPGILGATDVGYFISDKGFNLLVPGEEPRCIIEGWYFYNAFGGNIISSFKWLHLPGYAISNAGAIDLNKKVIIQRSFESNGSFTMPFIAHDEIWLTDLGKTVKLSPCPSFSVKRNGKTTSGDNEVSFEFKNTREDGRDLVLKGEVYLVSWGDDGKAPVFAKLNEPRHKLGPLLPGMSQEITFKVPEPPLLENNQKGEGKYFALVVESNGLLDTKNSILSDFDKDPRPLFD